MAAPVDQEQRHLNRTPRGDSAAITHLLVSTLFLGVAGALVVLSLAGLSFPDLLGGLLSYGRLRPVALIATMLGWLVPALVGGVYYVLPRLTGARLWREELPTATVWALAALTLAGMVVVGLGLGDGVGPLGLPWWLDLPVLAVLLVPLAVTVQTVRRRAEEGVFVTLWFVLAGVAWLPLLYLVGNLPGLAALGQQLGSLHFVAGFINLWVLAVGTGLAYYVVVKATDNPLSSRQLARVGFWSLAFAGSWAGPVRMAFGPTPDWLDPVAAVLTLALPIAALANAAAVSLTIDRDWKGITRRPALLAAAGGMGMAVAVGLFTSLASFRSAAALVGFTAYWDGVTYLALFGAGGLLVAAWIYQALPPLTGRQLVSTELARRHVSLTLWGVGATGLLLMMAGIVQGFGWTGGSFAGAFDDPAAAFTATSGLPDVLIGLAILTGLVAFAGQLAFVLNVYRTVTSGRATAQEVLVPRPVVTGTAPTEPEAPVEAEETARA